MSCATPVSSEDLTLYWAGELAANELERVDEHLMSCAACTAESERWSVVIEALRAFVPPIVTRAQLERLRQRGVRIAENTFAPGLRQAVVFSHDIDLLIHRLAGLDLSNVESVRVTVRTESSGQVLLDEPSVPFDAAEGVLIACQRHYASMAPDTVFEVRARDASGAERTAVYPIPHVFQ